MPHTRISVMMLAFIAGDVGECHMGQFMRHHPVVIKLLPGGLLSHRDAHESTVRSIGSSVKNPTAAFGWVRVDSRMRNRETAEVFRNRFSRCGDPGQDSRLRQIDFPWSELNLDHGATHFDLRRRQCIFGGLGRARLGCARLGCGCLEPANGPAAREDHHGNSDVRHCYLRCSTTGLPLRPGAKYLRRARKC